LLAIIDNFLFNRQQRVVLPEGHSMYAQITSGVPRGSVLGLLLFLLFINDVVDLFLGAVNVKLYADDIKIYLEIVDDADIDQLQMGIHSLSAWADTWQLTSAVETRKPSYR